MTDDALTITFAIALTKLSKPGSALSFGIWYWLQSAFKLTFSLLTDHVWLSIIFSWPASWIDKTCFSGSIFSEMISSRVLSLRRYYEISVRSCQPMIIRPFAMIQLLSSQSTLPCICYCLNFKNPGYSLNHRFVLQFLPWFLPLLWTWELNFSLNYRLDLKPKP